jgi:hypothetical protein
VFLTLDEKLYYMNTPITRNISKYYREVPKSFTQGYVNMNITANFKTNMMIWFVRNKAEYNGDYRKRYDYGYISSLVRTYSKYVNWNGKTKYYERIFDDLQIFINNYNIVSSISDDIYYAYRQPIDHGISAPDKNIYMYCFGSNVNGLTDNGYIDFADYYSKTTNIVINFRRDLVAELIQDYDLYIYYNGITTLKISKGYGSLVSVL